MILVTTASYCENTLRGNKQRNSQHEVTDKCKTADLTTGSTASVGDTEMSHEKLRKILERYYCTTTGMFIKQMTTKLTKVVPTCGFPEFHGDKLRVERPITALVEPVAVPQTYMTVCTTSHIADHPHDALTTGQ